MLVVAFLKVKSCLFILMVFCHSETMNAQEWNKLRKNWDDLLQVYSPDIIKYLFSVSTAVQELLFEYKIQHQISALFF